MKVYVVTHYYLEEPKLLGVFSTREKAEQLVDTKREKCRIFAEKYGLTKDLKSVLAAFKISEMDIDTDKKIWI